MLPNQSPVPGPLLPERQRQLQARYWNQMLPKKSASGPRRLLLKRPHPLLETRPRLRPPLLPVPEVLRELLRLEGRVRPVLRSNELLERPRTGCRSGGSKVPIQNVDFLSDSCTGNPV